MTVKERIKIQWDKQKEEYLAQGEYRKWTNPPLDYIEKYVHREYYMRLQHWLGEPVLNCEEFLNQEINEENSNKI